MEEGVGEVCLRRVGGAPWRNVKRMAWFAEVSGLFFLVYLDVFFLLL